jgi:hypothetical protein
MNSFNFPYVSIPFLYTKVVLKKKTFHPPCNSVACSQNFATGPYSESEESRPHDLNLYLNIILILSSYLHPSFSCGVFFSRLPLKISCSFLISPNCMTFCYKSYNLRLSQEVTRPLHRTKHHGVVANFPAP